VPAQADHVHRAGGVPDDLGEPRELRIRDPPGPAAVDHRAFMVIEASQELSEAPRDVAIEHLRERHRPAIAAGDASPPTTDPALFMMTLTG
jgi:hypothetical protein